MPVASPEKPEVLIVGAGPTGLVLALWLKRLGVHVRIIDKSTEAGTTSRALAIQARTLELYRQVGLATDVIDKALEISAINVWVRGQRAGRAVLGDMGRGLSPFPYVLIFPQDEHEKLLVERLRQMGVDVERATSLLGFEERGNRVFARLQHPDGAQSECESAYIAGCDGARSTVREALGVGFPGGTYERVFYVADVELHGPVANRELHVALDQADFVAVFPMKGENRARLIGTVKEEAQSSALTWNDVNKSAVDRMQIEVSRVNWFSTYHVHHRVASSFQRGRAFLAGDAAHVHSPVGGQGMNTGIGDAVNLAWKLADVLRGRADARLLLTYEKERIAFAMRLVATTDRVFSMVTNDGPVARRLRLDVVPRAVGPLFQRPLVRRFLFRTVSQIMLEYRRSDLSEGRAGSVRGGDRLPWVALENAAGADNFAPLASLNWQVHVYGVASAAFADACSRRRLPLHVFPWDARIGKAGLERDAGYLVRPDGYVAQVEAPAQAAALESYFDARGLQLA